MATETVIFEFQAVFIMSAGTCRKCSVASFLELFAILKKKTTGRRSISNFFFPKSRDTVYFLLWDLLPYADQNFRCFRNTRRFSHILVLNNSMKQIYWN